jgi:predicted nucleotide-binding protein
MAPRRNDPDSIPPALSPEQAIPLLRRQIERLEKIGTLPYNHPEVEAWINSTTNLLHDAFGKPTGAAHTNTSQFAHPNTGPVRRLPWGSRPDPHATQNRFLLTQQKRKALLEAFVEQLNDRRNAAAATVREPMGGDVMQNEPGSLIFIGHGRSQVWRELKDFLVDRLRLHWEEFNRESVAGRSTKERLEEMLANVDFAFIVMTAEDEHDGGTMHARANVIHEAGLFQGRLGFEKAIILLEEGCAEFSNIHGLTQIRFPKGNISVAFEEIRRVLEREKVLPAGDQPPSVSGALGSVPIAPVTVPTQDGRTSSGSAAAKAVRVEAGMGFLPVTQEALTIRLDGGHDQGFLISVESHADQEFSIQGVAAECNNSPLGKINRPPAGETWVVPTKGRVSIRWANDIHPVRALLDVKGIYQGSFPEFIDFTFQCIVEGEHKSFRKRMKVQVDALNRSITQWV